MSLPAPAHERTLKHRRRIDVHVYARSDGLWDVDAEISDVRATDTVLGGRTRPAGEPIHDMLLRLVVDARLDVVAAGSETRSMPYPGHCDDHADAYGRLVGLNLLRGFRAGVRERLGGSVGCTHLSELAQVLPTAVLQALAGDVIDTRSGLGDEPPFQIDRCHALRRDGEAVRLHYPRWYRAPAAASPFESPTGEAR